MAAGAAAARNNTRYVDPFIGTGAVENSLSGNNYPGATAPFGMVQLSPDTHPAPDWHNASGYDYNDSIIYGFSHTRLSGTGASDFIDVSLFPTTTDAESSRFRHSHYSLGVPLFDKCTVHLPSGRDFTITATRSRPGNVVVKSVLLNGKRHKALSISYGEIMQGGNLHFEL